MAGRGKKLALFPRVLIAIVAGALLGLILPDAAIRLLKTLNLLFAQILKFIVPLLVLGLVTPAIANLGKGAGKLLLTVVAISYVSTVLAGLFSYTGSSLLYPHYLKLGELTADHFQTKEFLPFIELKIPPVCDVMTALVLSFMIGIGIIVTKATALKKGFDEFGNIVKITIEKVIIPMLPVYIFTMICEMGAKGVLGTLAGAGVKIIGTGIGCTLVYLLIQYIIAGVIARKNPFRCLWNMAPAYLTGFSICSSSACIPVTQQCTLKNGVSKDIAAFSVPLCGTVHMCGSTIKIATASAAIAYMSGMDIPVTVYLHFVLMQAIAAVAAPGVMGGVLMASVGLIESILGFTPEQTAMVMTLYLALDGYGPACNVTGDGAVTLIVDRFFGKKD